MRASFSLWLYGHLILPHGQSRYATKRLLRSILLIAVVMIPLVLALIFMDGMMSGITDKYILLQDGHIQIYDSPEDDMLLSNYNDERIASVDKVVAGYGIIYSRETTAEVKIKGVERTYFNEKRREQLDFSGEPLIKEGSLTTVMISQSLSKTLGVGIGDRVAFMIVPETSSQGVRPVLAVVSALYVSGYHELDSSLIFMNHQDALKYFPQSQNSYTELLVEASAVDQLDALIKTLHTDFAQDFDYATWNEFNTTVYQNFITSRQVILMVFLLILLVAGVYVASIAQELVQDSMQAIALFKTVGALHTQLIGAYFGTVMTVTLLGLLCGMLGGVLIGSQLGILLHWLGSSGIAGLQYYLLDFPIIIQWKDLLIIGLSMLVISSVTVLFTLRRIRVISPLEVLQQD